MSKAAREHQTEILNQAAWASLAMMIATMTVSLLSLYVSPLFLIAIPVGLTAQAAAVFVELRAFCALRRDYKR